MKKILFPLFLVFIGFMVSPLVGYIASGAFLVWAIVRFMPNFYAVRGNKHFNDGDTEAALKSYKKAVKTGRASDKIKLYYALMLLRCGYPEDAESIFDAVVISKTASPSEKTSAKQFRCMAYCKQNRMREAMEDARELFADSKDTTTYSLMGYFMHLVHTRPGELLELCKEAYEYNSDERDIADNYLLALIKNGDYTKAKEVGEKLIEANPTFLEGYYHTAMCEKALGNKKAAKELLEHIPECRRTYLTTVSVEEVEQLLTEVQNA